MVRPFQSKARVGQGRAAVPKATNPMARLVKSGLALGRDHQPGLDHTDHYPNLEALVEDPDGFATAVALSWRTAIVRAAETFRARWAWWSIENV